MDEKERKREMEEALKGYLGWARVRAEEGSIASPIAMDTLLLWLHFNRPGLVGSIDSLWEMIDPDVRRFASRSGKMSLERVGREANPMIKRLDKVKTAMAGTIGGIVSDTVPHQRNTAILWLTEPYRYGDTDIIGIVAPTKGPFGMDTEIVVDHGDRHQLVRANTLPIETLAELAMDLMVSVGIDRGVFAEVSKSIVGTIFGRN